VAHEVVGEVEIAASADRVWTIITDFERYAEWNPYIVRAHGDLAEGAELVLDLSPPDRDDFSTRTTVAAVEPPRRVAFSWVTDDPDLFDGESEFVIEPTRQGCKVTHRQRFWGELAEGFTHRLEDRNDLGVEMMMAAMKARAER
jgi:uncharacterized protein YndB with AHSA1/START domain